jgi:rhodanese-related sulfurtransferase
MITHGFKKMLAEANAVIETLPVQDALELVDDRNVVFVDVRETVERERTGTIPGAVHATRGFLEFIADPEGPMHDEAFSSGKRLVLFCASGGRAALATKTLMDMGFKDVAHIAGGFAAWQEAGGPVAR